MRTNIDFLNSLLNIFQSKKLWLVITSVTKAKAITGLSLFSSVATLSNSCNLAFYFSLEAFCRSQKVSFPFKQLYLGNRRWFFFPHYIELKSVFQSRLFHEVGFTSSIIIFTSSVAQIYLTTPLDIFNQL